MDNPFPVGTIVKSHYASKWQGVVVEVHPRKSFINEEFIQDGWLVVCSITHDRNGLPLRKPVRSLRLSIEWLTKVPPTEIKTSTFVHSKKSTNRSSISVLPLESWMTWEDDSPWQEIVPILNRNGYFYDRKLNMSWYEYNGKAYKDKDASMFKYYLGAHNARMLSAKEVFLYKEILKHGSVAIVEKTLKNLLYNDKQIKDMRDIRREALRVSFNIRKKFAAKRAQNKEKT